MNSIHRKYFVDYPDRKRIPNALCQIPIFTFKSSISTYKLKNIKYPHYYTQLHFIFIPLPLLPIRGSIVTGKQIGRAHV